MSFFEFPHTRSYDGDLGFLIKRYVDLNDNYKEIVALVDGLETKVAEMVQLYETIPEQVTAQVTEQMNPIRQEMTDLKTHVEALIASVNKSIDEQFQLIMAISNNVAVLSQRIERVRQDANNYADIRIQEKAQEIYDYIDNLSKSFPPVVDPSDGKTEDLQTTLNHMWINLISGLTVEEFNSLRVTRKIFDDAYMTRRQFDNEPKTYLTVNPNDYMWSPFTFQLTLIKDVVMELAYLHAKGIKRAEFDGFESTMEAFDGEEITVYNWLWNNPWRAGA